MLLLLVYFNTRHDLTLFYITREQFTQQVGPMNFYLGTFDEI